MRVLRKCARYALGALAFSLMIVGFEIAVWLNLDPSDFP